MNRRTFFRSLLLGAAAVPTVVRAATAPSPWCVITPVTRRYELRSTTWSCEMKPFTLDDYDRLLEQIYAVRREAESPHV